MTTDQIEEILGRFFGFPRGSHEFNLSSFLGGVGLGAGASLVLTKAVRSALILGSSGLLLATVLNAHGYAIVPSEVSSRLFSAWEVLSAFFKEHLHKRLAFMREYVDTSDNHITSATVGSLTGLTLGMLLF